MVTADHPPRSAASAPAVRSVDRAARLLELLGEVGQGRVTDLAMQLDTHKSTVSRLLATLAAHDLVEQDPDTATFRLGHGLVRLAGAVPRAIDLGDVSRTVSTRLAREVRETVNLVVLDGTHVVCIDQVLGTASVTSVNWLGKRTPTHLAASGKVLLAHLPTEAVGAHLAQPLTGATTASVTSRGQLLAELATVRSRGWAVCIDEQEEGLTSVAAPIRTRDGVTVAAVVVSGPSFRIAGEQLGRIGAATVAAAHDMSKRTGHLPPATAPSAPTSSPPGTS